jgi:hypothetical protein
MRSVHQPFGPIAAINVSAVLFVALIASWIVAYPGALVGLFLSLCWPYFAPIGIESLRWTVVRPIRVLTMQLHRSISNRF